MPRLSSHHVEDTNNDRRVSHHPTGTIHFITVDGEGINHLPNSIDFGSCITCNSDLTNKTKYRRNGDGPICRRCYYTNIGQ